MSGLVGGSSAPVFSEAFIEKVGFTRMDEFPALEDVLEPSKSRKYTQPAYDGLPIYSCYSDSSEHVDIAPYVNNLYDILGGFMPKEYVNGSIDNMKGALYNLTATADFLELAEERLSYTPTAVCLRMGVFIDGVLATDLDIATPDFTAETKTVYKGNVENLMRQINVSSLDNFAYSLLIAPENGNIKGITTVLKNVGDNSGLLTTKAFNGAIGAPLWFNKNLFDSLFKGMSSLNIALKMMCLPGDMDRPKKSLVEEKDSDSRILMKGKMHGSILKQDGTKYELCC